MLIICLFLTGQDARHKLQGDELVLFFWMRDALVVEPFLIRDSLIIPVLLLLDQSVHKLLSSHGLWQVEVWLIVVCLLLPSVGEERAASLALPNVKASSITLLHELLCFCFSLLLTLWIKLRIRWSVTILIQISRSALTIALLAKVDVSKFWGSHFRLQVFVDLEVSPWFGHHLSVFVVACLIWHASLQATLGV